MLYHILALCLFLSVNGDLTPLILNTLNDTVSTQLGAHCLDGTPVVYYHRPGVGENATKFIIYFQGGGTSVPLLALSIFLLVSVYYIIYIV